MPNIITHGLFAKAVYDQLKPSTLKKIITKYPREFIIGSNGPDYLFFYKFFNKNYQHIRSIGNTIHAYHTNEFYSMAHDIVQSCKDSNLKEAMTSYLAGHLCHWALDSHTHPYIFYKTGDCHGYSASMHHRFESMLDTMMLEKIKGESIKTFRFYLLAKQSKYSAKAIASIYVPIVEKVYGQTIDEQIIQDSLDDWYQLQTWMYDPKGVKTKILKQFEKQINHPWLLSGNIVPANVDPTYDILNESKKTWCYPTDASKVSNESFMEIFNRAKHDVVDLLLHLEDKDYLLSHLNNASYDSGESEYKKMVHFDLIYGDKDENI